MLTKPPNIVDRQETQLAYEASYYPPYCLNKYRHKIVWIKRLYWSKAKIESACNEDHTELYIPEYGTFKIHWEYNSIPTHTEWKQLNKETEIFISLRISPLIKDGGGRVAVLGLLWDYYDKAINSKNASSFRTSKKESRSKANE